MFKKIISIGVLILMSIPLFVGCGVQTTNGGDGSDDGVSGDGLSGGFVYTGSGGQSSSYYIGYKINADSFDINDVNFDIYVGLNGSTAPGQPIRAVDRNPVIIALANVPWKTKLIMDMDLNEMYIVTEVTNCTSDLFYYSKEKTGKNKYQINFNYYVTATVPPEFFSESTGVFQYGIKMGHIDDNGETSWGGGTCSDIYYKKDGDTVMLSGRTFD